MVEAFRENDERVKADERRAGISGRFDTGIRRVTPGRRTESFASGTIGMAAVAPKPMMIHAVQVEANGYRTYESKQDESYGTEVTAFPKEGDRKVTSGVIYDGLMIRDLYRGVT